MGRNFELYPHRYSVDCGLTAVVIGTRPTEGKGKSSEILAQMQQMMSRAHMSLTEELSAADSFQAGGNHFWKVEQLFVFPCSRKFEKYWGNMKRITGRYKGVNMNLGNKIIPSYHTVMCFFYFFNNYTALKVMQ